MKALFTTDRNDMVYGEYPTPVPKAGEVRVKVHAAALCGGDVSGHKAKMPPYIHDDEPRIPGHEFAGEIDMLGEGVEGWEIGDRVCIFPTIFCGHCPDCEEEAVNVCHVRGCVGGYKPLYGNANGGMAEYAVVRAQQLIALPDSLDYKLGALVEPLAVALHAVNNAGDIQGKSVAVFGAGPIGLMIMECARVKGAGKIIVLEPLKKRREIARQHGADYAFDPNAEGFPECINDLTDGRGAEIVIEAVGLTESFDQAMQACRNHATVVLVGLASAEMHIRYRYIIDHELKLVGSICYTRKEFHETIKLLTDGKLDINYMMTLVRPLLDGGNVFEEMVHNAEEHLKAVLDVENNVE